MDLAMHEISDDLTMVLRQEFDLPELRVECGYEERVGYHYRVHGVVGKLISRVSDRARDWLAANTPYRFELQTEET